MSTDTDLVSPRQVARAIGVSESSLKRWCDRGIIKTVRTAGGHRKMTIAEVLRYIREQGQSLVAPAILGLPPVSENAVLGVTRSGPRLVEALLAGNELLARQIVFDLHLAKHPLSVICDDVIGAAFRDIGDRWACHTADVYQERRGCEIVLRILFNLRRLQPLPESSWLAIGGTIEGDFYTLPTAMAELVLRDAGFVTNSLGTSIPIASLIRAVNETRPKLFWLSVSHIPDRIDFVAEFAALSQACAGAGTALAVGGRALTPELRQRMSYSSYCDTMQHLAAFSQTLIRSFAKERTATNRSRRSSHGRSSRKL